MIGGGARRCGTSPKAGQTGQAAHGSAPGALHALAGAAGIPHHKVREFCLAVGALDLWTHCQMVMAQLWND